jgi:hypothetical protein
MPVQPGQGGIAAVLVPLVLLALILGAGVLLCARGTDVPLAGDNVIARADGFEVDPYERERCAQSDHQYHGDQYEGMDQRGGVGGVEMGCVGGTFYGGSGGWDEVTARGRMPGEHAGLLAHAAE